MPSSLPTELQIELVHYLRHDPSSLYRLCLVSRQLRFLAQPALFYRLDTIRIHPEHQGLLVFHRKLSYCGQKEHRHVLKLVQEFIVNTAGPNEPFIVPFWLKWCIPSHPIALLPYMSNLNHLTININLDITSSLRQLISSPFNLESLFFSCKWSYFEGEGEFALMTFISKQTRLKYLGLYICDRRDGALSDLPAGTLTRLEFIDDQFRLATRGRASVTGIHITETWALEGHIPEHAMEMERRLAQSKFVDQKQRHPERGVWGSDSESRE